MDHGSRASQRDESQQYRGLSDGQFVRTYEGSCPVEYASLDVWAVVKPDSGVAWLRLALEGGAMITPTAAERGRMGRSLAEGVLGVTLTKCATPPHLMGPLPNRLDGSRTRGRAFS